MRKIYGLLKHFLTCISIMLHDVCLFVRLPTRLRNFSLSFVPECGYSVNVIISSLCIFLFVFSCMCLIKLVLEEEKQRRKGQTSAPLNPCTGYMLMMLGNRLFSAKKELSRARFNSFYLASCSACVYVAWKQRVREVVWVLMPFKSKKELFSFFLLCGRTP